MSQRSDLAIHLNSLRDIHGILSAMKSLALMESHKLTGLLAAQQRVVDNLQSAAADFLAFHPTLVPTVVRSQALYLLIGSERGFCGSFNEQLIEAFERHCEETSIQDECAIVVGHKLSSKVSGNPRVFASLDGPSVSEEVQSVLLQIMETLRAAQARQAIHEPLDLTVVYHDADSDTVLIQPLQPFRKPTAAGVAYSQAPLLTLDPVVFMKDLMDLYLFSILHKIFYSSLMAENHYRLLHMDGAMHRLDGDIANLTLRRNTLRQEEITEEIELIMLSVGIAGERQTSGGQP
jgi:F-type H+-transporting ATPase subunit gamma